MPMRSSSCVRKFIGCDFLFRPLSVVIFLCRHGAGRVNVEKLRLLVSYRPLATPGLVAARES